MRCLLGGRFLHQETSRNSASKGLIARTRASAGCVAAGVFAYLRLEARAEARVPRAVVKMLNAGERSGRLGMVMERVASFSEAELNVTIKTLTSLIEPAIVAFLGVVVGGLVLALLLPIFTISKAL